MLSPTPLPKPSIPPRSAQSGAWPAAARTAQSKRPLLAGLHAVRGIAALMVVVYHSNAGARWASARDRGVDLFFVLSGFLMVYTTAGKATHPLEFMRRRCERVVPLYWIALTACALLSLRRFMPGPELVLDYLFVPHADAQHPGEIVPILFPGWTLNFEMAFYALFAVSLFAGERAWLVCSTVLIAGWSTLRAAEPTSTVGIFYSEPLVLLFAAGMLLARVHRTGALRLSRPVAIAMMAVGFAFIWWPKDVHLPDSIVAVTIVFASLHAAVGSGRLLTHLGDASYALYLFHTDTIGITRKVVLGPLSLAEPEGPLAIAICTAICVSACVAVAMLVHRYVEKPMLHYFRARGQRKADYSTGSLMAASTRSPPT